MNQVSEISEFQRKTIAAERASIVRYLRERFPELHDTCDAIAAGAHLYDRTLFSETATKEQSTCPPLKLTTRP